MRLHEYHPSTNEYLGPVTVVNNKKVYALWLKYLSYPEFKNLVGEANAKRFYLPLLATLERYDINTKVRIKHFLAQLFHESGRFKWLEEIWGPTPAQKRYEGRKDLGNLQAGDGFRFRGRGAIQLTGRANYAQYSKARGVDFVASPELVSSPKYALDVAGWYWQSRNLNATSDTDNIRAVTKKVNGGFNGLDDRERWLELIRKELLHGPF